MNATTIHNNSQSIIPWLLEGDLSIQYQTYRDILGMEHKDLQRKIATNGWTAQYLAKRHPDGHWGQGFYQPKWTSTHYSLLDLRNLWVLPGHPEILASIRRVAEHCKAEDGGINPARTIGKSDVCINGMFLNYACYFGLEEEYLKSIADFILSQQMPDGGFNCRSNRSGARHSSLHTTLSIAEGIHEYVVSNYSYRIDELKKAAQDCREFMLIHQLYLSDHNGKVIDQKFLRLPYPPRWRYDILRALDYFRESHAPYDPRMQKALDVLESKKRKDHCWPLQAHYPGKRHFEMEEVGKASRWNTLRALRVLKYFRKNSFPNNSDAC